MDYKHQANPTQTPDSYKLKQKIDKYDRRESEAQVRESKKYPATEYLREN